MVLVLCLIPVLKRFCLIPVPAPFFLFKEKNGEKYLIIHSTEKYEEVFSGVRSEIKRLNGGKELFYEKNYARIGVDTDDDLP